MPQLEFPGALGHPLAARLDLPDGTPRAFALFAHCFTGSKDVLASTRVSRRLARHGIAVLRFDFTGLGRSGGDFTDTTFSSDVTDLHCAAGYLREHHTAPELLVGHSLGGAVALAAASDLPEVRAVVTIAAPGHPNHLLQLVEHARPEIDAAGRADVVLAGRTFCITRAFVDDVAEQPQQERIAALERPLLVLHSPQDEEVGLEHAAAIFGAARQPRSFVSLDGADHLLTRRADAEYAADLIATWAGRYLA